MKIKRILKSDVIAYGVIDIRNKLLISYFCHVDKQHSKNICINNLLIKIEFTQAITMYVL